MLSEHHCEVTSWLSGGHWLGKERVSSSHTKEGLQPPLAHVYEAEPQILCCSCMAEEVHISKIGTQKDLPFSSNFKGTAWLRQWEGWCNLVSNGGFPRAGCDEKKAVLLQALKHLAHAPILPPLSCSQLQSNFTKSPCY